MWFNDPIMPQTLGAGLEIKKMKLGSFWTYPEKRLGKTAEILNRNLEMAVKADAMDISKDH